MNDVEIKALANAALDAAALHIQNHMGVDSGDVAGQYFSGTCGDSIIKILESYICTEINFHTLA